MYTIKTMNAISPVGLAKLPANQFEINNEANDAQGILVRSADHRHGGLSGDRQLQQKGCRGSR